MLYLLKMIHLPDISVFTDARLLKAGKILIAHPLMADANFARAVVFLCEHGTEGTLGFILNQPTEVTIGDLLPDYSTGLPINQGGPVQTDTLHMLHRLHAGIGGVEVGKGIYWGGSFDLLKDTAATIAGNDLRLFVGYAGWSPGQLERELFENSWLIAEVQEAILFDVNADDIWRTAILSLGAAYRYLANMPTDPGLN